MIVGECPASRDSMQFETTSRLTEPRLLSTPLQQPLLKEKFTLKSASRSARSSRYTRCHRERIVTAIDRGRKTRAEAPFQATPDL